MRLSNNDYLKSIGCDISVYGEAYFTNDPQPNCISHEYTLERGNCLTTTLRDGIIIIAYRRRVSDANGDFLIPDNEDLKEAIVHYVLYRHWLKRLSMKEAGSEALVRFHKSEYNLQKMKAIGDLNMPSLDEMENIKNT